MHTIRQATTDDREAIRLVHRRAFGQDTEGKLVDALSEGGFVQRSLVAEQEGQIVGHILFSELQIVGASRTVNSSALAPVAVLPECQGLGIGSRLIQEGLAECRTIGIELVFVLGEPAYYRRFGFASDLAARFDSPYAGEAFMALELSTAAAKGLSGVVHYAWPFQDME